MTATVANPTLPSPTRPAADPPTELTAANLPEYLAQTSRPARAAVDAAERVQPAGSPRPSAPGRRARPRHRAEGSASFRLRSVGRDRSGRHRAGRGRAAMRRPGR